MMLSHPISRRATRAAVAIALVAALSGCGGIATNQGYDSVHQPVVERTQSSIDLTTGSGGLVRGEVERLDGWFDALNLRYGDRVAVDDPLASPATRRAVEEAAAKFGLLVGSDVPLTKGYVNAGTARIIVTRTVATVPNCPDWSSNMEFNPKNGTHPNFGCAVNSNLAAMIANPEDLLRGQRANGLSNAPSSDKAIGVFQAQTPSGAGGGLKSTSSKGG